MSDIKLVVGLGNPGRKYEGTRHNVGFEVLAELTRRHGPLKLKSAFRGEVADVNIALANGAGQRLLLLWPQTYMNLSGASVLEARDFYKLSNESILIVCDDFNLPLAKLRVRPSGSAGGQKGLDNIILRLGTEDVPRLRIGVGPVPEHFNGADFVLGKFTRQEIPEVKEALVRAAEAVETWARDDIQLCMNRFN
jgi:peptidyl-tRNA hydrolase, PTH1 family